MTRRSTSRGAVLTALAVTAGSLITQAAVSPSLAGAEPLSTTERYVRQAFVDAVRDADPDPAVVEANVAKLDSGFNRSRWVGELLLSDTGRSAFVGGEYVRILDRPMEAGAGSDLVALMRNGKTRQGVRSLLAGSTEYFQTHGGGTNAGFIDSIYVDLLGRPASEGDRAHWLNQLSRGVKREQVAGLFQEGQEGRRVRVQAIFQTYLNRNVDAGGLNRFSNQLKAGTTEEKVIIEIAGSPEYRNLADRTPPAEEVVLLTETGNLVTSRPGGTPSTVAVSGLTEGTTLVGIDVRPATGVLYGLGSDGQLYGVNKNTGITTKVGAPIPAFDAAPGVGFDFNPAADRLRITVGNQNFRIQPDTGAVLGEGPAGSNTPGTLQYVPGDMFEGRTPAASAAAYTNSTRGLPLPATTALFDIDTGTDAVVQQNPANDGNLTTKGQLLLDATEVNGFDVSPDGAQAAYAVLTTARGQGLYAINLDNGEPKLLEKLAGDPIIGLAVVGATTVAPAEAAFGVSNDGLSLVSFTTQSTAPTATQTFTGLNAETSIMAIDVRPSTGQLFAIGSDGQLYTVNTDVPNVAALTVANPFTGQIGGGTLDPALGVAMDFNPAADAIRVVNGTKNFRVLTNGVVVGEGPPNTSSPGTIQYVPGDPGVGTTPNISGAAYTNSVRSATRPTATALFDIDSNRDVLVRQNPANDGNLTTIGALGIDVGAVDGFDISGGPGQNAYAVLTSGETQSLYLIDLVTGQADKVADLPAPLRGLAVK